MTDEILMDRYAAGDEQAFRELYSRYSGRVYAYLRKKLPTPSVDDAFQAVFLKLHRSRRLYRSGLPFAPWLFTIARTVVLDTRRAALRTGAKESLGETGEEIEQVPAPAPAPAAGGTAVLEAVSPQFLEVLPKDQRQALQWRYGDDLSFQEIAVRLGTSEANVRQRISRAVRRLRSLTGPFRWS